MKKNSLYDIEYFKKLETTHKNKMIRRRRIRIFIGVLIILFVVYLLTPLSKISKIEVVNNTVYSDAQIIKIANVNDGDLTLLHPSFLIKNNLNNSHLFKGVKVKKNIFNNVTIDVDEAKPVLYMKVKGKDVFYDENDNEIVFEPSDALKQKSRIPELTNLKNDKLKEEIIKKLSELDPSVLTLISQINHKPQKYDDQYFEFIMSGSKKIFIHSSLNDIIKVGSNYHNFAANTKYECTVIEFINSENKAVVKKC